MLTLILRIVGIILFLIGLGYYVYFFASDPVVISPVDKALFLMIAGGLASQFVKE
jgi:hypothetical protein